jgi:hypothetical protein
VTDFYGDEFIRVPMELQIKMFKGRKKINSLPCFPIDTVSDSNEIKERLIKRGKKYRELSIKDITEQRFLCEGNIYRFAYDESVRYTQRRGDEVYQPSQNPQEVLYRKTN